MRNVGPGKGGRGWKPSIWCSVMFVFNTNLGATAHGGVGVWPARSDEEEPLEVERLKGCNWCRTGLHRYGPGGGYAKSVLKWIRMILYYSVYHITSNFDPSWSRTILAPSGCLDFIRFPINYSLGKVLLLPSPRVLSYLADLPKEQSLSPSNDISRRRAPLCPFWRKRRIPQQSQPLFHANLNVAVTSWQCPHVLRFHRVAIVCQSTLAP